MISPSWLADVLAALVLAIALFSAIRLVVWRVARRQDEVDADGVHVLTGVAMAGMFVPRLTTLPALLWEIIFACGAVWFGWRALQVRRVRRAGQPGQAGYLAAEPHYCRYPVPHLIDCLAMLYMFWAVRTVPSGNGVASGGMSAMTAGGGVRLPFLGLILALLICGYAVWLGDRLPLLPVVALTRGSRPDGGAAGRSPAAGGAIVATPAADGSGDTAVLTETEPATASLTARSFLAPRAAAWSTIAMGVAMGVMLVDLL